MKTKVCLAICLVIAVSSSALAAEPTPEERWARGIADDFWQALLNNKAEQAAGLLSPELARQFVYKDETAAMYLRTYAQGYTTKTTVVFESTDLAPDRSEVVFRGSLGGKDNLERRVQGRITMRIAKEGGGGRWSIRLVDFPEWKRPTFDR